MGDVVEMTEREAPESKYIHSSSFVFFFPLILANCTSSSFFICAHPGRYYAVLRSNRVVPVIFRRQNSNVAGVKY
jgi:hypothetical protein